MIAQKNRNTEKPKGRNVEKPKARNKNVEAPRVEPEVLYTKLPMPAGAGDWICNGYPEKYADMLYDGKWPIVHGPPRAQKLFTEDQLVAKGLVGIYFAKKN